MDQKDRELLQVFGVFKEGGNKEGFMEGRSLRITLAVFK